MGNLQRVHRKEVGDSIDDTSGDITEINGGRIRHRNPHIRPSEMDEYHSAKRL